MKANQQILDEASNWFIDFRAGDIDAQARHEFHQWLRRSPDHIQAYLDIASTYAELPAPTANGEIDVQGLIDKARSSADLNVVPLKVPPLKVPGSGVSGVSGLSPSERAITKNVLAIAASLVLTTLALTSWFYIQHDTYSTDIGEQRSLALADGSTIQLNSRSRIRVRYTDDERRIDLIDGQALFQVAKNPHRPFIVHVNDTQVRAVGTQFDVYRKQSGTVVTVLEGRVAVIPPLHEVERPGEAPILIAGEQLTVPAVTPADARVQTAAKPVVVNPNTATAWTQRQLIFENASLSDVAEEFNRYTERPIKIECTDPCFSDFHISGTYSSTNPESLLRFLRLQPGIHLVESDTEIRITQ
jgi:transmembrane sensor